MWARYAQSKTGFIPVYSQTDASNQCVVCGRWSTNARWYDSSGAQQGALDSSDNTVHGFHCAYSPSGDLVWFSDLYDASANATFTVRQNATDSSGYTAVCGTYELNTSSDINFHVTGAGGSDISRAMSVAGGVFITQHSADGVPQWIVNIESTIGNTLVNDIQCASGNRIIIYGALFNRFGASQINIYDSAGVSAVATLNSTTPALFVAVFAQDGTFVWCGKIRNVSGGSSIRGWNIAVDDTHAYLSGASSLSNTVLATQGDAGASVPFSCQNTQQTAFTVIWVLATGIPVGATVVRGDPLLSAIYTETGSMFLVSPLDSLLPPYIRALRVNSSTGRLYYSGRFRTGTVRFYDTTNVASGITLATTETSSVYLAAMNGSVGQHQWALKMEGSGGGGSIDVCYDIYLRPDGATLYSVVMQVSATLTLFDSGGVARATHSLSGGDTMQYVLAAWSAVDGGYLWSLRVGGINHVERCALLTDGSGAPVLFGSFEGAAAVIYGPGSGGTAVRRVIRVGGRDQFVAKFAAATGVLTWAGGLFDTEAANLNTWMTAASAGAVYGVSSYVEGPLAVVDAAGTTRFSLAGVPVIESMAVVRWPRGGS
jgi:hypothetical protein